MKITTEIKTKLCDLCAISAPFAFKTTETPTNVKETPTYIRRNATRLQRNEHRLSWKSFPSIVETLSVIKEMTNGLVATLNVFSGNPICLSSTNRRPSWNHQLTSKKQQLAMRKSETNLAFFPLSP